MRHPPGSRAAPLATLNKDGTWTLDNTLVLRNVNAPGCAAAGTVIPAGTAVTAPGDLISHCQELLWAPVWFGWPMWNGELCGSGLAKPMNRKGCGRGGN